MHIGASTKKAIATGVQFPISDEAMAQLSNFKDGAVNYVQLVGKRVVLSSVKCSPTYYSIEPRHSH